MFPHQLFNVQLFPQQLFPSLEAPVGEIIFIGSGGFAIDGDGNVSFIRAILGTGGIGIGGNAGITHTPRYYRRQTIPLKASRTVVQLPIESLRLTKLKGSSQSKKLPAQATNVSQLLKFRASRTQIELPADTTRITDVIKLKASRSIITLPAHSGRIIKLRARKHYK